VEDLDLPVAAYRWSDGVFYSWSIHELLSYCAR
jgi:hypothetical protein